MNRVTKTNSSIALLTFFFISVFISVSTPAQILPPGDDPVMNPFDFTNTYYYDNGIRPKGIIGRRTGFDGLSVFGKSSDPIRSSVRVTVTLPAYDQNGGLVFWYPLGDVAGTGFTDDKTGFLARETAKLFPIYIFPGPQIEKARYSFANNRQAPIIDNSWTLQMEKDLNPIGIRQAFLVNYTEKAFSKECAEIMEYLTQKNGLATDDTPIIKTIDDIRTLSKYEMISTSPRTGERYRDKFMLGPVILDPTKGVIAKDAFLWMAPKDGFPLPVEEMFTWHFGCLQEKGIWCE